MRNRIEVKAPPYVPETYIAVSRVIAGMIDMPYVNGRASTTPMTSVRPGSTATNMPSTRPAASARRLTGCNTIRKPAPSCWTRSITPPSYLTPMTRISSRDTSWNGPRPSGRET